MGTLSRRNFLHTGAAGAIGARPAARPNVLFIMSDQLRYDCVGANGNRIVKTPSLDRLASESANFTHAFVQAPVCVPSRISYFTGRYPHSHKNRVNYTPCDPREVFFYRLLKEAGYRTGSVGKLHFHPPTAEHARSTGLDVVQLDDGVAMTDPYSDYVRWRKTNDPQADIPYHATAKNSVNPFKARIDYRYTPTAWVGAQGREVLRRFAASGEPFFLFVSFFKPHGPHTVPAPYDSMYSNVEIPMARPVTLEDIRRLPPPVQKQILRGKPEYAADRERLQWIYRSYYGGVSMVDHETGLLLEELERSGKAPNTLVIFCSDHGDQLLEHGLHGKNVFFEASVRIPMMVRWPGQVRPGKYSEFVETVDVAPSVLSFCGVPVPARCQGKSVAPLISPGRGPYSARDAVFAENIIPEVITNRSLDMPFTPGEGVGGIRHPDAKMVRTRRWKFNYYPGNGGELYDLENDPAELHNLYADAAHQTTVREMKQRLLDWLITTDENDQIAPRWLV